jgi:hypothetical protein
VNTFVESHKAVDVSSAAIAEARAQLDWLQTVLRLTQRAIEDSKRCIESSRLVKAQFDRQEDFKISD